MEAPTSRLVFSAWPLVKGSLFKFPSFKAYEIKQAKLDAKWLQQYLLSM
jgi:hypothetical protein